MQYKQTFQKDGVTLFNGIMRINDDGSVSLIPNSPDNRDWIAYQAWLAQGNTPLAASK